MSNQNGNEQEFVHLTPENGTNAENDKQQQKMKPLTAFVQIVFDGPANGQKVKLSLKCATVAEHAAFMLKKLNESQGSVVGLQLNGPVAIASVLEGNLALIDYDVPLEVDCKYTFKFKLAKVQEEVEDGPGQVEELAKRVAQLAEEKEEMKKQVNGLTEKMAQMGEEQAKETAKSAEELAKCQQQLKDVKNALEKLLEEKAAQRGQMEQLKKWKEEQEKEKEEKHQKLLEEEEAKAKLEEEQRVASAEYGRSIGVPIVTNLEAHYDRGKLLQLLEHGAIPSIYIQKNQQLNDPGLLQSIVDLMATAEKPAQLVGEVKIEYGTACFTWPKRGELKLKEKKPNVALTLNEASTSPSTHSGCYLAEYELINRKCHFQVLIHYAAENYFDKLLCKFICRRLA